MPPIAPSASGLGPQALGHCPVAFHACPPYHYLTISMYTSHRTHAQALGVPVRDMWDLRPCLRGPTRPPCCEHITRVEDFYVGMFEADVMVAHHSQSRPGGGGAVSPAGKEGLAGVGGEGGTAGTPRAVPGAEGRYPLNFICLLRAGVTCCHGPRVKGVLSSLCAQLGLPAHSEPPGAEKPGTCGGWVLSSATHSRMRGQV